MSSAALKKTDRPINAPVLAGCGDGRAATAADCRSIFGRIVEVGLRELGYRDPALSSRRARELSATLAEQLRVCEGSQISNAMLQCVNSAKTTEEISHTCLGSR